MAEFGVISVMLAFWTFADMVSSAGLPAATFRLYNESDDENVRGQTLGSSLFLFTLYASLIAIVVWLLSTPLSEWLLGVDDYANVVRIVAVVLVLSTLIYYGFILLRINVRPLASSIHNILQVSAQMFPLQ